MTLHRRRDSVNFENYTIKMVSFRGTSDLTENHSLKARSFFLRLTVYYLPGIFTANSIDKYIDPKLYFYFARMFG